MAGWDALFCHNICPRLGDYATATATATHCSLCGDRRCRLLVEVDYSGPLVAEAEVKSKEIRKSLHIILHGVFPARHFACVYNLCGGPSVGLGPTRIALFSGFVT